MGGFCSGSETHVHVHIEKKRPEVKPEVTAPKVKDSNSMIDCINRIEDSEVKSNRGRSTTDTLKRFSIVEKKPNKDVDEVALLPAEPEQLNDVDSIHQLAKLRQPESNVV